jgi:hypothetical protein
MRSKPRKFTFLAAGVLALLPMLVQAQSTSFTYQGKLTDGGNSANGICFTEVAGSADIMTGS